MAGTVTYGQSIMGGNAYITSDGNEYSSQSAAQAHQSQLNTPATPASPATSASITTPSVPTVSQKTGSSAISGGANPAQYSYNTPTQTSTAAPSSSSSLYYYKDTSGQQHVVSDLATAQAYAAPGSAIYNFTGAASGGYGSGDIGSQVSTGTGAGYTGGANTAMIGGSSAAHITDYMSTLGGSATYNSSTGMVQITSPNGKSVSVSPSSIPGTANVGGYLYVSDPTAFNNYLATATGYNASVATAQNKITSQLAQVLDTLLPTINAQLTAPTTTTAPTASEYQPITWDQAMSQAQQIVNPATAAAQQQLTDTYQQNLSQLPYTLAGRGELQSGLLGGGTAGLTQAQASASFLVIIE